MLGTLSACYILFLLTKNSGIIGLSKHCCSNKSNYSTTFVVLFSQAAKMAKKLLSFLFLFLLKNIIAKFDSKILNSLDVANIDSKIVNRLDIEIELDDIDLMNVVELTTTSDFYIRAYQNDTPSDPIENTLKVIDITSLSYRETNFERKSQSYIKAELLTNKIFET